MSDYVDDMKSMTTQLSQFQPSEADLAKIANADKLNATKLADMDPTAMKALLTDPDSTFRLPATMSEDEISDLVRRLGQGDQSALDKALKLVSRENSPVRLVEMDEQNPNHDDTPPAA